MICNPFRLHDTQVDATLHVIFFRCDDPFDFEITQTFEIPNSKACVNTQRSSEPNMSSVLALRHDTTEKSPSAELDYQTLTKRI